MDSIQKKFVFLSSKYNLKVIKKQESGSFPFVTWSNDHLVIKVVFDLTDENPVHIFIYDADDKYMYSYQEIAEELKYVPKNKHDIDGYLFHAASVFEKWLSENLILFSK